MRRAGGDQRVLARQRPPAPGAAAPRSPRGSPAGSAIRPGPNSPQAMAPSSGPDDAARRGAFSVARLRRVAGCSHIARSSPAPSARLVGGEQGGGGQVVRRGRSPPWPSGRRWPGATTTRSGSRAELDMAHLGLVGERESRHRHALPASAGQRQRGHELRRRRRSGRRHARRRPCAAGGSARAPCRRRRRRRRSAGCGGRSAWWRNYRTAAADQILASDGPFALHRDAVALAPVRPVVPHRPVLGAAVVPERHRVRLPAEAALEQRVLHVLVEPGQDAVALVARDAEDAGGEAAVDVQRLPPVTGWVRTTGCSARG